MDKKRKRVKRIRVEDFFSIRLIGNFSISYDNENIYYITNATGLPQVWKVPVSGGKTTQVTDWKNSVKKVLCNPKRDELVFTSDENGNEQYQIYKLDLFNSKIICLSSGFENSQCNVHKFDKNGEFLLISTNKRNKYNFDSYFVNLETSEKILVKSFDGYFPVVPLSLSKDNRYITYNVIYSNINQDILLYDTINRGIKNITSHDINIDVFNSNTEFDDKSENIFYISDQDRDFKGIKIYNIQKNKHKWFVTEDWDIHGYEFPENFKHIIYSVNNNGKIILKLFDIKNKKYLENKLPVGNYTDFKFISSGNRITGSKKPRGKIKNREKIVFLFDSPQTPPDIYVYDLIKKRKIQKTHSLTEKVVKNCFTKPIDVFYDSFDGLKIHCLLYIPMGTDKNKKNPVIVWVHGGPEWQEKHSFNKHIQVLSNAGYIVFVPNFRGSTGYGGKFQKLIYKDWGGAEFVDILYGIDYLKKLSYIDKNRIAIVGGSFGGFLCLTAVTKAPEMWKCAVDMFGPSNLITFLKSLPEYWKKGADRLIGNIESDKKMLKERSPINYVDNIICPLMVIQGKNDVRVVREESEQIVNRLLKKGKNVKYILLDDEGHGFSKVSNIIRVFNEKINFLDNFLKK